MNRLAAVTALAAALLAVPASARAQVTQPGTYVFTTVDEVAQVGSALTVTGVLQGEAAASTRAGYSASPAVIADSCQRMALLAQAKPGQYLFEFTISGSSVTGCRLRRAVP